MKTIRNIILTAIVVYLISCFIEMEYNPTKFSGTFRFFMVVAWVFAVACLEVLKTEKDIRQV